MWHDSRDTTETPTVDVVQQLTGHYGRWQLRSILLIFLCQIPSAWFMSCIIYTAPMPTPRKEELSCGTDNASLNNPGAYELHTDRQFQLPWCQAFAARLTHILEQQHGQPLNVSCVQVQDQGAYDWICSQRMLLALAQSAHALGALLGGLLAHRILQHLSPRRLFMLGLLGQLFCGNLTGLVDSYLLHVYFRCLTSLCCTLVYSAGQIILNDITAGKARLIVTTLSELCWSVGLLLLPAISVCFNSWSHLHVAISSTLLLLIWLPHCIANAPRWLLQHQRIEPALRLLLDAASYNKRRVPPYLPAQLTDYAARLAGAAQPSYWQLWQDHSQRTQLIYVHCVWSGALIVYQLMLLLIRPLGSAQLHVNTAALALAEMLGFFVGLYIMLNSRQHWRWTGNLMIAAGLSSYLLWLLPVNARVPLQICCCLLLKLANAASIAVLSSCSGELVAPEIRLLLLLSVLSFSRFCLLFSPLLSTISTVHHLLPLSILATLGWLYGVVLRRLNRYYWSSLQSHLSQLSIPDTLLLYRRSSTSSSELSAEQPCSSSFDQSLTISISNIWHISFHTIQACDNAAERDRVEIKSNSFVVM